MPSVTATRLQLGSALCLQTDRSSVPLGPGGPPSYTHQPLRCHLESASPVRPEPSIRTTRSDESLSSESSRSDLPTGIRSRRGSQTAANGGHRTPADNRQQPLGVGDVTPLL